MPIRRLTPSIAAILLACATLAPAGIPDSIDVAPAGQGRALVQWPRETPIEFEAWVVSDGWQSINQQWKLRDTKHQPRAADGSRGLTGHFDLGNDRTVRFQETVAPTRVDYRFTADAAIADLTGIYWAASLPADRFAGGTVIVGEQTFNLPATRSETAPIGEATADRVRIRSADGTVESELTFDTPRLVRVQDARTFGAESLQLLVPVTEGPIQRGTAVTLGVTFATRIAPKNADARITIDFAKKLNPFDGIGGNFVYAIEDPATRLALKEMTPAWVRVGLDLRDWEPVNDNGDPGLTNVAALKARDVEGSSLRRRFELDRELFEKSEGRMIGSIWYPPEWLFEEPAADRWRNWPGRIPRARWDEFSECIVSYLEHLKTAYGVEPMLISLNEPDYGVHVLQDGAELRDWTRHLGAALRDANLKTRILLGDVASLERGLALIQPTLDDEAARSFVGGLAYHPWAGENAQWPKWSEAAERFGWPLFATEMGSDANAWHDESFGSPFYALRLARRYVEQMRDARTRALFEWEWTGDFSIALAKGSPILSPRGALLKMLTAATPTGASVIGSTCDQPDVIVAALAGENGIAIHVVNLSDARSLRLAGLPAGVTQVTVKRVDPIEGPRRETLVDVVAGRCLITIEAGEVMTITSRP